MFLVPLRGVVVAGERFALPLLRGGSVDGDAHGASGPLDDLHRGVDVARVQIRHLGLGDLADLVLGDLADLVLVRDRRALLQTGGLLDHLRRRRRLGDEGEGPVLVDGDLDRHDVAAHGLRLGVVRLAELHDVDAVRTERGTDRRGRRRGTGLELHLDQGSDLLLGRHVLSGPCWILGSAGFGQTLVFGQTFWIWLKLSSTGVSRPKISTSALIRWASGLISVIVACRVANGPSTTMTESPTPKSATSTFFFAGAVLVTPPPAWAASASAAATTPGASIFSTSSRLSGTGCWLCPTKPVTDGVCRTVDQDSSVRSIRTST